MSSTPASQKATVLERLSACPLCGSSQWSAVFEGLSDVLCRVPGTWSLARCGACCVAFLNPRLPESRIHEAYGDYYTHAAAGAGGARAWARDTLFRGCMRSMRANERRGGGPLVRMASAVSPVYGKWIAGLCRKLPPASPGARMLDIGCGNGWVVRAANALGMQGAGMDFDPLACAAARRLGIEVAEGRLPNTGLPSAGFDAITLHHVIEHLHDPAAAVRELRRLLAPGGVLLISTPNIDSFGSQVFGRYWRGLEPPRHLVLFNPPSLAHLLEREGFTVLATHGSAADCDDYFQESERIMRLAGAAVDAAALRRRLDEARQSADTARHEQFFLLVRKPGAAG